MIDHYARQILPRLVSPLINFYHRHNLSPNQITFIGLIFAVLASLCIIMGWNILALILWWMGRLFDGTDGIYARQFQLATPFGAYWDFLADMAAYSLMVIAFALAFPASSYYWLIILFLYILCSTTALSLGIQEEKLGVEARDNRGLRLGAGLAEGGETGIAYSLFLIFPAFIESLAFVWIAILTMTVVARSMLAYNVLRSGK
ncbi:MAG: CDP-alcohol phosphatidyltransferase family protein [Oligoflexus sp.]